MLVKVELQIVKGSNCLNEDEDEDKMKGLDDIQKLCFQA